jgi:hypothetical protein
MVLRKVGDLLWQLRIPPSSVFNNHAVTSYISSLKTIICVSSRRHFTLQRITLTQAPLRGKNHGLRQTVGITHSEPWLHAEDKFIESRGFRDA